jgi:D-alanyl-D-alanine carboxypeptidase/D-alanyl-D-alanine-endopeptidase (penicillin-binding protein 4)
MVSGQQKALESLMADSAMEGASVGVCFINTADNRILFEYNSSQSLVPASILKLITSSAAIELLGPDYSFKTLTGYTGTINKRTGTLSGDIVIIGGGDPALGSPYFSGHYGDVAGEIVNSVKNAGIKKVDGRIFTDDSRYDYQPVPAGWVWEDLGNYYGAGVYGLSVFDNSYSIHFRTSGEGSIPEITGIVPSQCRQDLSNMLRASGTTDKGYVFSAPYNSYGWMAGTIPVNRQDFVLKASICDPPLLFAKIIDHMLDSAGIDIKNEPATARTGKSMTEDDFTLIFEKTSPSLREIIKVLNHESVNLYAESLLKELGKVLGNEGSTASGIDVLFEFLNKAGIVRSGIFIEDGSGLSPGNAITSGGMAELLSFMKGNSKNFDDLFNSLPEAGKAGTLKYYFKDPVFESNLRAKSGSMTRVRSYAGYFRTAKGNDTSFCIIVNDFSGSHQRIVNGIEEILKEVIINN